MERMKGVDTTRATNGWLVALVVGGVGWGRGLAEVGFEEFAAGGVAEAADGFFLDLTDALAGEAEFLADFLEGHFLATDAEEEFDDVALALGEGGKGPLDFGGEGFLHEGFVGDG